MKRKCALVIANGFRVVYGAEVSGPHKFCGHNDTRGATCPNCDVPLHRFLLVSFRDEQVADLGRQLGVDELPLLWHWPCGIALGWLSYKLLDRGASVELVEFARGAASAEFPYADYPREFPESWARLDPVPPEVQGRISSLNAGDLEFWQVRREEWARPHHQLGGEPLIVESSFDARRCPICRSEQEMLAGVADDCLDRRGLAGNDMVQVVYWLCRRCVVVSACQGTN